ESYFRGLERKIIAGLSKRRDAVIDAGGGAVIDESNVKGLKANGVIFCLNAAPEIILRRTEKYTHRPLLNVPDPLAEIKKLLKKRKNYYKKADYQIDTSAKSVDEVSREIIKKWNTGAKEDRNQK
ncbi:MAG: shikimate kinase, partial [Candidatus Omnitrophota bacterium]|nr:shikimate kinase [Candidatus Omnitrophota bacterium]